MTPAHPEPRGSAFVTAEWRALVMASYEVDPRFLVERVPAGTELESWEGRTLVSIVAFRFLSTRILGIPALFHRDFAEINVRFYVRRRAPEGWRHGVVFLREIVPHPLTALIARRVYNEPYVARNMRYVVDLPSSATASGQARYEWRGEHRSSHVSATFSGVPRDVDTSSEESFVTEHYWGYNRQPDGSTLEYGVAHPRWRVWSADHADIACDLAGLVDAGIAEALAGAPTSVFVAEGSPVAVYRGTQLKG